MRIPASVKVPFVALSLIYLSNFLAPQATQAHHNTIHSAEQAATKVVTDTSTTVKQTAVKAASNTSATLPLTLPLMAGGGVVLLSFTALGLYSIRKKQSV